MNRQVALVTGASSGIGAAIATTLAAEGWIVYAAARRVERLEQLPGPGIIPVAMDLTDDATLVTAVRRIIADGGRIDALVNNAGYGAYGSVEHVPLDEARRQFEVNLFGMARLIQLVTPHLRSRGSGRIVNISSVGGKIYEPLGAWYHAAKFAVEGLSDSLRVELRPFGIDVVVIEPGPIRSEWSAIASQGLVDRTRGTVYQRRADAMARAYARTYTPRFSSGPEAVAEKVLAAVTTVNPPARYPAGRGARAIITARRLLPDRIFDLLVRAAYRERRPAR